MGNDSAKKVKMESLESLMGSSIIPMSAKIPQGTAGELLVRLPLDNLHTYHSNALGHPFRVLDDAKMAETVESVKKNGVLVPGIARPDRDHPREYEIISGHRRKRASELAGLKDMPFIIRDLTDDEATVIMVDSNIQREDLLPSEKAWAYRMKYDAMKKLGTKEGIRTDKLLEAESGESRNSIQRYIRLTYLIPELLRLVDEGKVPKSPAEELSYLNKNAQNLVLAIMKQLKVIPSGEQAKKLKEIAKDSAGALTDPVIRLVLEKQPDAAKISLPTKQIRRFFPESYTGEQIQEVIYRLLEEWQEKESHK